LNQAIIEAVEVEAAEGVCGWGKLGWNCVVGRSSTITARGGSTVSAGQDNAQP